MSEADPISEALGRLVAGGDLPGAVTLVWRRGRLTHAGTVGWRDIAARPMTRDTIFRIASVSKPITSIAAVMLMEEGRFSLDDPIARWAPEFAKMRVLRSPEGPLDDTVAADRPITFDDLLTHRAGFTYGDFHTGPINAAYAAALGPDIDSFVSVDGWIAGLAGLPLIDQPGRGFHYGRSTDLLGLLIARMEETSLGELLQRRIFGPLGMADTGFLVPPTEHDRRAVMYTFDAAGKLKLRESGAFLAERPADMAYESGGAGLWSTADDLLTFARLFIEGGQVDGVRLLMPETLGLITANRLTENQREEARMLGMPVFDGHGFGLGVAVVLDPEAAQATRCKGGTGTVGWPGAFGGWWQADPTDGSVMIFLTHSNPDLAQLAQGIGLGAFMAITEFHALASAAT